MLCRGRPAHSRCTDFEGKGKLERETAQLSRCAEIGMVAGVHFDLTTQLRTFEFAYRDGARKSS